MCGIAGYSIARDVDVDATALTKLLLAGLAERGEDASGYAWRTTTGTVEVVKHALPPHEFLASVPVGLAHGTREAIVHVRDHTKGRPTHHGNNHPIRHGRICGVHNGIIQNDDALFVAHGRERALPGMSVDSEAIFMLMDKLDHTIDAFDHLVGSYSVAWFDDRNTGGGVHTARGEGRPLVLGIGEGIVLFASTEQALRFATDRLRIAIDLQPVPNGTAFMLHDGTVFERTKFTVQRFTEPAPVTYSTDQPNAELARRLVDQHFDGGAQAS